MAVTHHDEDSSKQLNFEREISYGNCILFSGLEPMVYPDSLSFKVRVAINMVVSLLANWI